MKAGQEWCGGCIDMVCQLPCPGAVAQVIRAVAWPRVDGEDVTQANIDWQDLRKFHHPFYAADQNQPVVLSSMPGKTRHCLLHENDKSGIAPQPAWRRR